MIKFILTIGVVAFTTWIYLIARVFICLHGHDLDGSFYWEGWSFAALAVTLVTLPIGLANVFSGKHV